MVQNIIPGPLQRIGCLHGVVLVFVLKGGVIDADIGDDIFGFQVGDERKPFVKGCDVAKSRMTVDPGVNDCHLLPGRQKIPAKDILPGFVVVNVNLVGRATADGQKVDIRQFVIIAAQSMFVPGVMEITPPDAYRTVVSDTRAILRGIRKFP